MDKLAHDAFMQSFTDSLAEYEAGDAGSEATEKLASAYGLNEEAETEETTEETELSYDDILDKVAGKNMDRLRAAMGKMRGAGASMAGKAKGFGAAAAGKARAAGAAAGRASSATKAHFKANKGRYAKGGLAAGGAAAGFLAGRASKKDD